MRLLPHIAVLATASLLASPALAAEGLDGATMSALWALPFAGILLSIATGPLLVHHWWHAHYGKAAAFWGLLALIPMTVAFGPEPAAAALFHTLAGEYIPFILMLLALFTAAGGLVIRGNLHGSPALNTGLLALGATLASIIGTTGAAMVLVRPLLRANDARKHNAHVFVFFIFLVANIGGALTPLGDPPLFLGFLRGVSFFWTTGHLIGATVFTVVVLLALFFALDTYVYRRDGKPQRDPTSDESGLRVTGLVNLALIGIAVGAIVMSGIWKPGIGPTILGTHLEIQNLLRETVMIVVAVASLWLTNGEERKANGFNWEPILEVAKLFAAIFTCIIPVMAILQAGSKGAFAPLLALVAKADGTPNNMAYFWLTGVLSSLLDNAPTYLVFFQMASGDAVQLMGPLAETLKAISLGAVFMGAMTYIGNAPNFMVFAIARDGGVKMPGFFGYIAWSAAILGPLFLVMSVIFVR